MSEVLVDRELLCQWEVELDQIAGAGHISDKLCELLAAPVQQQECEFHGSDKQACEKYSGSVPCEPAPADALVESLESIAEAHWSQPAEALRFVAKAALDAARVKP